MEIAREKGVKVIRQQGKGKTDALKTALNHVEQEYMLLMDGDYTYPPIHIKDLYLKAFQENATHVIGARTVDRKNIPPINRIGNYILTKTFNVLFNTNLRDLCSGMYLIKTSEARQILYETKGFSIEAELAAHTASSARKIADHPIKYRERIGKSKLSRIHGLHIFRDLFLLAWYYHPAFFIFASSSLALIPASIILSWVAVELLLFGVKHSVWAIIGVTIFGVGALALLLAIMALYLKRLERRLHAKIHQIYRFK